MHMLIGLATKYGMPYMKTWLCFVVASDILPSTEIVWGC